MFLQRLVTVLEAPGVAHVALNALNTIDALNYTGPAVDVQSFIKKFESWVPLTVPTAELRCSPCQQSPVPIQRIVQPVVDPAVVFVAESKPEGSQEPSVEVATAQSPIEPIARRSYSSSRGQHLASVEIVNVPELHKNQPSVTPVENPKPESTQLPSEHTANGPKQCQALPSAIPAASSSSPTTVPTLLSPYVPALQHTTPRRSGLQGVASRLFSYEMDAKYLRRRAEAKLRRAAAAAKKSSRTLL